MINVGQVKKLANLSKLKFSQEELELFSSELSEIEELLSRMKEVDVSSIEPLTSVHNQNQRLREDVETEKDNSEDVLKNAPGKDGELAKEVNCFVVPKVVE